MATRKSGTATSGSSSIGLTPYKSTTPKTTAYLPGGLSPLSPTNPYKGVTNPGSGQTPPPDPALIAAQVAGNRNVALSDSYAGYQNAQIENEYGLGSDTSDPYSRARLLTESRNRSVRGTANSYAAAGQYHSGAYQRAQGENDRNYQIGYDQLARSYSGAKANVAYGQLQTYANNAYGVDDATYASTLNALRR